ncbi:MAG TPA: cupin domain-containing protein [Flavisolibacter sp.]|jgi:mannose-6-phosphate isomerase-like protein (cupin superfamily)|nr:cupin domain-containing protein [Flavisolibacter sp.]
MEQHFSPERALLQLRQEGNHPFTVLFQHGTLQIEYFAPHITDNQQPHEQDEIYIIISGAGLLVCDEKGYNCKSNDVLFVPAGAKHHFENFTDDFATWVIFYGPKGGEGHP